MPVGKRTPLRVRFQKYLSPPNKNNCILWTGSKLPSGYGRVGTGGTEGKMILAHRAAWELAFGEIPSGMYVLHHCDTPSCVNPAHLFIGTHEDNMRDCRAKGRNKHCVFKGEENKRAKLSLKDVEDIRERYRNGEQQRVLAKEYGVHFHSIYNAIHRVTWKDEFTTK